MADILYSGKGLATKLPEDNGGSMSRLSDFITKAEEIKYNAFKENEKDFLKASNVDPLLFISDKSQKAQSTLLNDFNNKWASEYKKYQGNLSTEAKQQMQSEKNVVIAQQQKMQSDMERAIQDRDIIAKDTGMTLDHDDANARWANYITTGTYDTTPLKPSAIDPDLYYSKRTNKGIGTQSVITVTNKKDGKLVTERKRSSATEEEGRQMVEADMINNPRLSMGYIKKFQALKESDPETYVKYLDTSGDGVVDASEEQAAQGATNPIIRWAQDNYWQKKVELKDEETTKPVVTKEKGITINIGGKDISVSAATKRPKSIKYGGVDRPNLYAFGGGTVLTDIPTDGAYSLARSNPTSLDGGSNMSGQLIDYDADTDALIIRTTTGIPSMRLDPKSLVQVPLSNVVGGDKLPIMVDGKEITIGELKGEQSKTSTSGVNWVTK